MTVALVGPEDAKVPPPSNDVKVDEDSATDGDMIGDGVLDLFLLADAVL